MADDGSGHIAPDSASLVDEPAMLPPSLGVLLGTPFVVETLKYKPGRRLTRRVTGSRSAAIVKVYASHRAPIVAAKVERLATGPAEPQVPTLLHVDEDAHLVALTEVPGRPLREAVLAGDLATISLTGRVLAGWHAAWRGKRPPELAAHTPTRELAILRRHLATTTLEVAQAVTSIIHGLDVAWSPSTVVHRDLYEEQLMVADRIGLIDVDDAALGPPELDVGNLLAHLRLLAWRRDVDLVDREQAFLHGYRSAGTLDARLLSTCRTLTLLRLACLNDEPALVSLATDPWIDA